MVQILANLGMLLTDDQYEELMSRLHLHNGHMEYIDFVLNFGDPRPPDASSVVRTGNHHVNAIRGDQYGMTADEVEAKLRAKLRENFAVSLQHGQECLCDSVSVSPFVPQHASWMKRSPLPVAKTVEISALILGAHGNMI